MKNKKIFRDPVYRLIQFDKNECKSLLELIDSPEVQRLKRIKQLGMSYQTYSSAVHDRFSHSLGVSFLVGQIVENLEIDTIKIPSIIENGGQKKDESIEINKSQLKLLLQIAGLLHDVGHGPFSHTFEKISKKDHEQRSVEIILDEETQVNQILRNMEYPLGTYAAEWITEILDGTFNPRWVKELISSQIDADRMDYLMRDAHMCGVQYSRFDRDWLINNMELREIPPQDNRLGIVFDASKGIYALESFIISRYHMYEQVYFHKTTRCMEVLAAKIFERTKQLIDNKVKIELSNESLNNIITNKETLSDFLNIDDFEIIYQIKIWQNHEDKYLSELSKAFINRKPFKMCREKDGVSDVYNRQEGNKINEIFCNDLDLSSYYLIEDNYIDNPYKDMYLLGKDIDEAENIWLGMPDGTIKELGQVSRLIRTLKNSMTKKARAYVHRKYYEQFRGGDLADE